MSMILQRLAGAARRSIRFVATATGIFFPIAALLGVLAAVGVAPAVLGTAAIVLALAAVVHKLTHLVTRNRQMQAELVKMRKQIAALEKVAGSDSIARAHRRIDATRRRIDRVATLARETGAVLRAEIAGSQMEDRDWFPIDPVLSTDDEPIADLTPVLSIAIPGYNRPDKLWDALESIVDQVEPDFVDRVEVIITDDRSTDKVATEVAHQFARDHSFIGFRMNETNLGLERNLVTCTGPCRGEYLWVFGNDDLLGPGILRQLMPELEEGRFDLFLLDKERISRQGEPVERRPGTRPSTNSSDYGSILELAEVTGLISSFGWISQIVRRRAPYVAVDPEPYYDTTLHPHLGMMLEAFPSSPVAFRSSIGVIHRTQDPRERLAESAGRPEASYMAGGAERDARWFGAGYAAMLQRVVDRSPITPEQLARLNEAQWHEGTMFDWIEKNWQTGVDSGLQLDEPLLADALRLFESVDRVAPAS